MNLTNYTLVRTHKSVNGGVNNLNTVLVLDERLQTVKTFTSKLSLEKCNQRARLFLKREEGKVISKNLTAPLGSMFSQVISGTALFIERIEENTFQLFDSDFQYTTVDGDLLINILYGKQKLSTLKFE